MRILFAVASYLVGSIPTGYLFVRAADRSDIRKAGSRSTGATNVLRVKGLKYAAPVMIIDVLKGYLPAFLGLRLFHSPFLAGLAGFLAVVGHCFPFSIGFRGGKGVATSAGVFIALAVPSMLASLAVFILVVALTRFVSLGSILAALAFPLFVLLFRGPLGVLVWSLAIAVLVIFRHKDNVRRLLSGTERKLGEKAT